MLEELYRPTLALVNDLYQYTMALGYWREGLHERRASFVLQMRRTPFGGAFAVCCGTETAAEYVAGFKFDAKDRSALRELNSGGAEDGRRQTLFPDDFLDYLAGLSLEVDVDAMPEGTVCLPREPLLRVEGPLIACQLLETPLLNLVGHQSLIATKAARICHIAAAGQPVLDFGLRRAHGFDGAVSASRAAYVGGCAATSNVQAAALLGIPARGTHAHSWVMAFADEIEAFRAFARTMPEDCVLLLDTYDTLRAVDKAIIVAQELRDKGGELAGVRLDSGDLLDLSKRVRDRLDEAGFPSVKIIASNDLDEFRIAELRAAGARIDGWGVGTRLITALDDPAFSGSYKVGAMVVGEAWTWKAKVSEDGFKVSDPGRLQVRRVNDATGSLEDWIFDLDTDSLEIERRFPGGVDLLRPLLRGGRRVGGASEPLAVGKGAPRGAGLALARRRAADAIAGLPAPMKLLQTPSGPAVRTTTSYEARRNGLIERLRG